MSPAVTRRDWDAVVVGGGVAGLSVALWLARYRHRTLVVDAQEWRSASVEVAHGYLGRDPTRPTDLLAAGRRELARYPDARYRTGRITAARRCDDGTFELALAGEVAPLRPRHVVLATGVRDRFPAVENFAEHYGASAFHCPACDGYEAHGRHVVALGWDARLAGFAATLGTWAASVTVVTNGRVFEGRRDDLDRLDVELVEERASALLGRRGALRAVRLAGGRELPCGLLFFSVAHTPNAGLARQLGCAVDDEGYLVMNDCNRTTVPGVYAAGDLTPGMQLTQVAAAKGTVAGISAAQSLLELG